jgi:hypothetical protein
MQSDILTSQIALRRVLSALGDSVHNFVGDFPTNFMLRSGCAG